MGVSATKIGGGGVSIIKTRRLMGSQIPKLGVTGSQPLKWVVMGVSAPKMRGDRSLKTPNWGTMGSQPPKLGDDGVSATKTGGQ